ncbi:MAG: rhamnulokinase, partial [Oscillospiraceae bacterium]|nr:rhamnulokinase [Oscillospiraceae bacterium]
EDNYWSRPILDAYELSENMFGRLVMPGTIAGKTTEIYNRQLGTKGFNVVLVCEHDTASAFLAATAGKDCAIISSGTWALVGTETEKPIINEYGMKHNIANEGGYPGHHRLLRNVMGNWLIQEIRAYYREEGHKYNYAELEAMAQNEEPFSFLIDVDAPQFFEPGNMPQKIKDTCMNLYGKAPQSVGALVRCVYESLAFKYRWAIEILEHMTGKTMPIINIVGGGSKDDLMCNFTACACGKPVIAGPSEATSYGNMLVQLIAAGEISGIEEGREILKASFVSRRFEPSDTPLWDEKYKEFKTMFGLE